MGRIVYIDNSLVLFFAGTLFTSPVHIMSKRSQEDENKNIKIIKRRKTFARNLRNARSDAGLRQEEVATITGLTQSFISVVERGDSNISLDNAQLLADAVGQPLCKLICSSDK